MITKKCRFVLVKDNNTPKVGDLVKSKFGDIHILTKNDGKEYTKTVTSQLLFLISIDPEEKIEVSDMVYFGEQIIIVEKIHSDAITFINPFDNKIHTIQGINRFNKVVATKGDLSPATISKFIIDYNNSQVVDVEIEMEEIEDGHVDDFSKPHIFKIVPKLTDGYITTIINFKDATLEQIEERFPTMYTLKDIMNALHSVELRDNKNYTKIYDGMLEFFRQHKRS